MNTLVPIPSFTGGVSQQPDSLRFTNQFPQVDNFYLNPLTGAERRPGSRFIGELGAFSNESVGHLIDRDDGERYIVVAKSNSLRVYDADTAQEFSVVAPGTTTPATLTYLTYSSSATFARKHLRFLTIADFTFVLNRQKTVAMLNTTTPEDSGSTTGHAFIWVRKGNYNRSYDIILRDGTNNAILATAQTGSGLVSSSGASDTELDLRNEDVLYEVLTAGAAADVWELSLTTNGIANTYTYTVQTGDTAEIVAKELVQKVNGAAGTAGTQRQNAVAYYLNGGRFIVRSIQRKFGFTLKTLTTTGTGTVTSGTGTQLTGAGERSLQSVDTAVIAARLAGNINSQSSTITAEVFGAVIRLTSSSAFTRIETSSDAAQSEIVTINRSVTDFADLPDTCQHGYIVEVRRSIEKQEGDATDVEDSYYSQFIADSGSGFGKGRWVESMEPGSTYQLDSSTLPHQLVRRFGGTQTLTATVTGTEGFTVTTPFYSEDDLIVRINGVLTTNWVIATPTSIDVTGVTIGDTVTIANSARYFEFGPATWIDKAVGSDTSVPEPSIVGQTLNDLAFFKNRLVFLAGSNVVMSETFRYLNLWRTTMLSVVDTDPIDIQAAFEQVVEIERALPFGDRLVLFDRRVQFTLTGSPLTPRSVALTPTSRFELSLESRPLFGGVSILAPFERDTFGGLREMLFTEDVDTMDGEDVTIQCPKFIKGRMLDFCASTVDGLFFARGEFESKNYLYVYKTLRYGRERQQSAWSRWAVDPQFTIRFIGTAGSDLYMVLSSGNNTPFIVKMGLDPNALDISRSDVPPGVAIGLRPYLYKLDCITTSQAIGGSNIVYDPNTNTTDITLPWHPGNVALEDIWVIQVNSLGDEVYGRRWTVTAKSGHTITVKGEADNFEVGVAFESVINMGKPSLRRGAPGNEVERLTGYTTVVGGRVRVVDSGYLQLEVTSPYRGSSINTYSGKEIGNPTFQIGRANLFTGEYQFWCNLPREEVTVFLRSNSPLPLTLSSAEWQIRYDSTFNSLQG